MRTGHFKENPGQLVALSDSKVVWTWFAGMLCVMMLAPFLIGNYGLTLMVSSLIAIMGAVALNILTGQTGLISLGQAGFLAVGAYSNALLLTDYHWPVWLTLPASGLIAALISLLVGYSLAPAQGTVSRDYHAGLLLYYQPRHPLCGAANAWSPAIFVKGATILVSTSKRECRSTTWCSVLPL